MMKKTDVYVYTVRRWVDRQTNTFWQYVFDCEVSDASVLAVYREETGDKSIDVLVRFKKRAFYQTQRNPVAVVPEVQAGIMCALSENMNGVDWFKDKLLQLSLDQPIIHEYLLTVKQQHGELPALVGAIVYGTIESQIEADQL